jgi:hypothetical protein
MPCGLPDNEVNLQDRYSGNGDDASRGAGQLAETRPMNEEGD